MGFNYVFALWFITGHKHRPPLLAILAQRKLSSCIFVVVHIPVPQWWLMVHSCRWCVCVVGATLTNKLNGLCVCGWSHSQKNWIVCVCVWWEPLTAYSYVLELQKVLEQSVVCIAEAAPSCGCPARDSCAACGVPHAASVLATWRLVFRMKKSCVQLWVCCL